MQVADRADLRGAATPGPDRFAVGLLDTLATIIRWSSWITFGAGIGASYLANQQASGSAEFVRYVADGGFCFGVAACGWSIAARLALASAEGGVA